MPDRNELLNLLRDAREHLAGGTEDELIWSTWGSAHEAQRELDDLMSRIEAGVVPELKVAVLFAATGPLQEASMGMGWHEAYLELASRADKALRNQ